MRLDVCLKAARRAPETMLCGSTHGDELSPPRHERAQCLRLPVGQGAWHRAHRIGTMRQGARIQHVGLGELSRRFRQGARVTGIDDHNGQTSGSERSSARPLRAPGRFAHNTLRRDGLEACDEHGDPHVIIRDSPAFSRGAEGNVSWGFGHIKTNKHLGRHTHS
jgi:hypothetical protein